MCWHVRCTDDLTAGKEPTGLHSVRSTARSVALRKEGTVHAAIITSNSTASGSPQRPPLPEPATSHITPTDYTAPVTCPSTTAGYDPVLLIAALEEIDSRQLAFEWLLDADLLCACLA